MASDLFTYRFDETQLPYVATIGSGVKKPSPEAGRTTASGGTRGDHHSLRNDLRLADCSSSRLLDVIPVHRDSLPRVGGAFLCLPRGIDFPITDSVFGFPGNSDTELGSRGFIPVGDLHQSPKGRSTTPAEVVTLFAGQAKEKSVQVHFHNLDVSKHEVKKHLSHALDISCSNSGMDIYANRRRWLAHWIDTEYGGNKARAAEATGYSRSQISQYLSDNYQEGRSPQEKAARSLEQKFGKPSRVMETPSPGTTGESLLPTPDAVRHEAEHDVVLMSPDGTKVFIELKSYKGPAKYPKKIWSDRVPIAEYLKILPDYVSEAFKAIARAYLANVPRETFDAITVLFSQLRSSEGGTITAPKKDETVESPSAMRSLMEEAEKTRRDAESRLATRSEEPRGARRAGEKRSKNIRH